MKKFSKKLIWYKLILNILPSFFMGFVIFSSYMPEEDVAIDFGMLQEGLLLACITTVITYVGLAIYHVLYYKCSGYELTNNEITCVKGVLFKKKSIVEYKKIHAINSKQNILEKLFGISVLQVDSGSTNTAHTAEIQIIENDNIVDELMKMIKAKQNKEDCTISEVSNSNDKIDVVNKNVESIYNFNSKRKAIYTALQVAWIIVGGIFSAIIGLCVMIVLVVLRQMELPVLAIILFGSLAVLILLSLVVFVVGLIGSLIAFYDFKLVRNKNDIEVSYGLITKINNTFKYNKIKAIRITQSIIQKIFGFVTIKVEVIGYTTQSKDDSKMYTSGMLVPLCRKNEVNKILDNLLPNYIPLDRQTKSEYFFPFVSYNLLFSFIFVIFSQIILSIILAYYGLGKELLLVSGILWSVYALYILIVLVDRTLAKSNSGFSISDGKLCIYRGSFVQETIVVRKRSIIGIDSKTTHFRRKKNIYTYTIHFKSNATTNTVTVLNVDKNDGDKIYELVKY